MARAILAVCSGAGLLSFIFYIAGLCFGVIQTSDEQHGGANFLLFIIAIASGATLMDLWAGEVRAKNIAQTITKNTEESPDATEKSAVRNA